MNENEFGDFLNQLQMEAAKQQHPSNQDESTAAREPTATQRTAAKEIHGLFVALVNEGFTSDQAMTLVAVAVTATNTRGV